MPVDLEKLRQNVSDEVNKYVYPYSGVEVGNPKSSEWIAEQLCQIRSALVAPYWTKVGDEPCIIVADDGRNYCLAYSPKVEEYFLVMRKGDKLIDISVYGDAVGCFMAR